MTEGDFRKDYRIIREYVLNTISESQKNMVEHEIWWGYAECLMVWWLCWKQNHAEILRG